MELQPPQRRFDSGCRLYAPKVFVAARRLAKSQERVGLPLGAQRARSLEARRLPSKQSTRRFDSDRALQVEGSPARQGAAGRVRALEALTAMRSFRKAETSGSTPDKGSAG